MRTSCAVVGAGPAGTAVSLELARRGVDHVVLERDAVASTWRLQRWNSFRLNTSAWMNGMLGPLPAGSFPGRDEVVDRLVALASGLPVRTGTPVTRVRRAGDGFTLVAGDEELRADAVVVATGLLNVPRMPAVARRLPPDVLSLAGSDFRSAQDLPPGAVLVVGSGQSGAQIAEDLAVAGRRVLLSTCRVGRFDWHYRGRETFAWLQDLGYWDQRPADLPDPAMMRSTQPLVASGGRTLSLPILAALGVRLLGRVTDVVGARVHLDDEVAAHLAFGDEGWARTRELIDAHVRRLGVEAPPAGEDDGAAAVVPGRETWLDLREEDVSTVLWCTGFGGDLDYLELPVRGPDGQVRRLGTASEVPGLWFAGFPWLVRRRSGIFHGFLDDATRTVEELVGHLATR